MSYIYVLYNSTRFKFYIGQTNNLARRMSEHNQRRHSYTGRFEGEWELLYTETAATRSEAIKRERQLKSYRGREFIKSIINDM